MGRPHKIPPFIKDRSTGAVMAKLWQRTHTADGKSQLHDISLTDLRITRPSVIYLSGFMTTDSQPGFIAGGLKRLEEAMGHRPAPHDAEDVDLYAWSHSSLTNVFNMAAYNLCPQSRASAASYALAQGVIMPLVVKDFKIDGDGNLSGTPLPAEEAKRNLRNITFFGYSAGTITAQECFNASLKMMKQLGYTADAARDVLHDVALVSAGNVSRPSKEKDRFTTVYLVASNDRIIRAKNRIWAPLKTLFARYARNLNIKKLSAASAFISAAVSKQSVEWRMAKGKTWQERIRPLIPSWTFIKSYHELPHYVTHDESLSQFAKIVNFALTNAVARAPVYAGGDGKRLDPLEMIQPPKGIPAADAAAYNAKIEKAMVSKDVRI